MLDHTYVARFGWTPRGLLLLLASILFVVIGAVMAVGAQPVWGTLAILLGAAYATLSTMAWLSRRVALAVTADGITLGLAPPWPANRSAFIPWPDVEAIVVWRQAAGRASLGYIGVQRRPGAPPLPGSASSPRLRRVNKAFAPDYLPEALVADSRPINFWRLDTKKLAAAVSQFAPGVPVVDRA